MAIYINGNLNQQITVTEKIVIGNEYDDGIKLGGAVPTYGWRDLIGLIKPDPYKVNAPDLIPFRSVIREYSYSLNDMIDCVYHVPHDYALGTDMFIHVHWGHNGTDISDTNNIKFTYTYADRTDPLKTSFPIEQSQTLTISTHISTHPQYCHSVDELQLSISGGTGNYIDTNDIEVDGLILVNVEQLVQPVITNGDAPFIFTIDIHYQSTGIGTKSSAANFYD